MLTKGRMNVVGVEGGGAHLPSCCPKRVACPSPPAPLVAPLPPPASCCPFLLWVPFLQHPLLPSAPVLDLPGSQAQNTSWSPPSFGQWYRGEAEAPGTETSSVAPSQLQGGEETPQPPHLEPVGSPTAPNS